jgi:hypothetical protein
MSDDRAPIDLDALVRAIVKAWSDDLDLGSIALDVQVGSLAEHGDDRRGATFGSPDGKGAIVIIDPSAETCDVGLERVVVHELVHVVHGSLFPEARGCDDAAEWLIDQSAELLIRERALISECRRLRANIEALEARCPECIYCECHEAATEPINADGSDT